MQTAHWPAHLPDDFDALIHFAIISHLSYSNIQAGPRIKIDLGAPVSRQICRRNEWQISPVIKLRAEAEQKSKWASQRQGRIHQREKKIVYKSN